MAGRRGNGEGSIAQREDGSWRGRVVIGELRRSVAGKTRREVQAKLRALVADAERGILPPTEQLTLGALVARWLDTVARHTVRPSTLRGYDHLMRLYVLPTLGARRLAKLQAADVQALYAALLDRGLAPKTVRNTHVALRRAVAQAVTWGLVPRNVVALVTPPRVPRAELPVFTEVQVGVLLAAARGTAWEATLTLGVATGMRMGEVLGLRWSDVDLDAGSLRVARQLGQDNTFSEPKTAKGRRVIDLPAPCVRVLREERHRQLARQLAHGPAWRASGLVCCTRDGGPLRQSNVLRSYKRILVAAGLPERPFHALRHTHATLLLARNVHPKVVQERMGHATIAMTLDVYSAYVPSMGRGAADSLEALFG